MRIDRYPEGFVINLDNVSIGDDLDKFRIVSGHPNGLVLEYYKLKVILSDSEANELIQLGIKQE